MTVSINDLRGMTDAIAAHMKSDGISNSDQLLESCRTPAQRKAMAGEIGCEARDILELANRADLKAVRMPSFKVYRNRGRGRGGFDLVNDPRELVDLTPREVTVRVDLAAGDAAATVLTNDLTHEYLKINAEYST